MSGEGLVTTTCTPFPLLLCLSIFRPAAAVWCCSAAEWGGRGLLLIQQGTLSTGHPTHHAADSGNVSCLLLLLLLMHLSQPCPRGATHAVLMQLRRLLLPRALLLLLLLFTHSGKSQLL
jgi:hypothetical protein